MTKNTTLPSIISMPLSVSGIELILFMLLSSGSGYVQHKIMQSKKATPLWM